MSDMDEPEEAIDSTSDDVSDSGTDSSVMETAASQGESDQNDSQKSGEFTAEAPVDGDNVMDKKVIQESHDDEYEDDDSEDDEYEDDSEEDESEDDEYEDESEEDDERDDESEDDELEEDESEDGDESEEYEDDSEDDERDDESEEDELEEDELEDEDESEEYEDDSEEDDSDDEEVEGLGDGDVDLAASTDVGGDGEIADDVLAHESQHPAMHESGAEPILQSEVSDRVASSGVNGEDEARALAAGSAKHAELQFQAVDLPIMHGEPFGMRRADRNGCELLDAMAGRNSVFGFGCTPIRESLVSGLSDYLGEGSRFADVEDAGESVLSKKLQQVFDGASSVSVESMALLPSPDLAVEYALQLTRRFRSEKAFRTIALTGSDHGRTGMCRTASGQPQLHEGLGPMMAGFSHLPVGDLDALRASMDEQTAGVLLSPLDLGSGAVACEAEYLAGVRAACNERGALLIIDETQLVFGATGNHFSFSSIADVHADIVVTSSGLFAGLSGGLVLASQHASTRVVRDLEQYPLVAAALMATLDEMELHGLPDNVHDSAQELAVLIAERLSGFEFVRDMRVTGMTIGIECDVNAIDVVAAAAANGLRVETAGDTAIRIQPPLLISEEDRQLLLKRLVETMEAIERETAELTL